MQPMAQEERLAALARARYHMCNRTHIDARDKQRVHHLSSRVPYTRRYALKSSRMWVVTRLPVRPRVPSVDYIIDNPSEKIRPTAGEGGKRQTYIGGLGHIKIMSEYMKK